MAATVQNSKEPERSHDDKRTQLLLQHYRESIPEKNRHKLDKKLDFEHGGVQKHLGEIADSMDEWEGRVAEELMLTKVDIASIKTKHPQQLNLQTRAALSKWQQNPRLSATYWNLMKAFLKANKANFAEAVCKVLTNTSSDSGLRRMLSDGSSVSDQWSMEESLTSNSLRLSSFGESSVENDPELELNSDEQVKSAIQVFQRRFADLVVKTVIDLQTKQKATEFVANFVTSIRFGLTQPLEGQYDEYMNKNAKMLKKLDDIEEVMAELKKLWNFVDYHLIEYIINQFGSEKLKEEMKTFTDELRVFRRNTTVSKFAKYWPEKKLYPPEYREMDIKIDVDPNCWTLEDLENARKEMCTKLDKTNPHPYPSLFAILVSEVKEGCVVVVWAVPRECLSAIIRCELNESLITEPKVLSIKIDGVVLDKMMLLNVCSQGKVELVRSLIESGVDPNHEVKEDNSTALHMASQNGNMEIVELLLKSKANVEAKKKNEATPLLMASYAGHTDVVELLLSKGANPNAKTNEGQTPLTYASFRGHTDLAKLLLKRGAKVNQANMYKATPLIFASEHGYIEIVSHLLDHGADVKLRNQGNASPLSYACQNGHPEVVRLLLKYNAPTEEKNEPGATPLIVGSAVGQTSVVKVMLDHKANINATTSKTGLTSLMIASLNDHLKVVQLLLRRKAKVDAQSKDGFTALIIATKNENEKIVEALLFANANPNLFEKETGWTAIFFAAKSGNIGIMNMLIECGANVNHRDKNYITAMDVSTQAPNPEDVQRTLSVHSKVKFQELNKKNSDKVHKASHHVEDLFISFAKIWAPALEKRLLAERERRSRSTESGQQQMLTSVVVS